MYHEFYIFHRYFTRHLISHVCLEKAILSYRLCARYAVSSLQSEFTKSAVRYVLHLRCIICLFSLLIYTINSQLTYSAACLRRKLIQKIYSFTEWIEENNVYDQFYISLLANLFLLKRCSLFSYLNRNYICTYGFKYSCYIECNIVPT